MLVDPPGWKKLCRETVTATQLPAGRYLVKIYIDREDKTKQDRDYDLGEAEFYGQVEFNDDWKPGYDPPKIVHAPVHD